MPSERLLKRLSVKNVYQLIFYTYRDSYESNIRIQSMRAAACNSVLDTPFLSCQPHPTSIPAVMFTLRMTA